MENILNWGVEVILWCQQFSPALDSLFKAFTFLGDEYFFLVLLSIIYWCTNRKAGLRLIFMFLVTGYAGAVAKTIFDQPRPHQYTDLVTPLIEIEGLGFPSLHTLTAVTMWGFLASRFRRTWLWILAGILMVCIPLSRVYLGVHFPTDLLGGYIIGGVLLLSYLKIESGLEKWLAEKPVRQWAISFGLSIPLLLIAFYTGGDASIVAAAMLMGAIVGFTIERRWVRFESGGIWWKQVLRFLLGIIGLFVVRAGLKRIFPEGDQVFRAIRYGCIGLWLGVGGPLAFVKLRLAEVRPARAES